MITKKDLQCYRINYKKEDWLKYAEGNQFMMLPLGILDAVSVLCDEVQRLRKWK